MKCDEAHGEQKIIMIINDLANINCLLFSIFNNMKLFNQFRMCI